MKRNKSITLKKLIFIGVGILIMASMIFFAGIKYASNKNSTNITSSLIENELKQVSELTTTDYAYSKVGKFENSLELNGWQIPLSTKSFLLTYTGHIKLGVDLNKANVEVDQDTIHITLEKVEILENIIDEESIEIYDESNNLFNPIKIEDYKEFALQQKEQAQKEAIEKGLYDQAKEKTEDTIKTLVSMIQKDHKVEIEFTE